MSLSSTKTKIVYVGDSSTLIFPYDFRILAKEHIEVLLEVIATGVSTVLTVDSDYTVSGVGVATGGNITLLITAPAKTINLVLRRATPRTQETDWEENDPFPAETTEDALDKLTMIAQELQEQLDRALLQIASIADPINLPIPVANALLGWDAAGISLENKSVGAYVVPTPGATDVGKVIAVDASLAYILSTVGGGGGATVSRVTFTNASLSSGILTVTHAKGLTAPYGVVAFIFNNSGKQVVDADITGLTNTFTVDLKDYGTISGTWEVVYLA